MDLVDRCRSLFAGLRREAFGGVFHLPSSDAAQRISAWWSAHHVLVLRHFDPELALAELRTLYAACQDGNGFVAHDRLLPDAEAPQHPDSLASLRSEDGRSPLIDPPLAAYAAARLVLDGQAAAALVLEMSVSQDPE